MDNESGLYHNKVYMLSAEAFIDLLDSLYDLLADAKDSPRLKSNIVQLIRWVESHIPATIEQEIHIPEFELEMGASSTPDFMALQTQAQQQEQQ